MGYLQTPTIFGLVTKCGWGNCMIQPIYKPISLRWAGPQESHGFPLRSPGWLPDYISSDVGFIDKMHVNCIRIWCWQCREPQVRCCWAVSAVGQFHLRSCQAIFPLILWRLRGKRLAGSKRNVEKLTIVVVVVVRRRRRRAYTRRHNYNVTSAPPSRLSLNKQKCLQ